MMCKKKEMKFVRAIELLNNLNMLNPNIRLPRWLTKSYSALIGDSPQDVVNKYMMRAKESDIYICIHVAAFRYTNHIKTGEIIQSGTEFELEKLHDTNQN